MTKHIQVQLHSIAKIVTLDHSLSRVDYLQAQKQAIYVFRDHLIGQFFEIDVNDQIKKTEHGKPYLSDYPNYAFNHTHSRNYYAIAMSQDIQDIGVDIEEMSRRVRFDALAQHAFHSDEIQQWDDLDQDPEYWFKVWTTKEAVLKASGLGIRLNLNELNTCIHPEYDGGICEHERIGVFAFQNYKISDCMLTVAWRTEHSCKGFALPQIQIHSEL